MMCEARWRRSREGKLKIRYRRILTCRTEHNATDILMLPVTKLERVTLEHAAGVAMRSLKGSPWLEAFFLGNRTAVILRALFLLVSDWSIYCSSLRTSFTTTPSISYSHCHPPSPSPSTPGATQSRAGIDGNPRIVDWLQFLMPSGPLWRPSPHEKFTINFPFDYLFCAAQRYTVVLR